MRIKFEELEKLPKNWMFFLRVYSAFAELAQSAGKFATLEAGKEGEGDDLVPEDVSRLAKEAAAYAAKNPHASPFHLPDPFAALVDMVERVRELPRLKCEEGDVEAYRRGNAVALAERCGWFAALTITRLELLCGKNGQMVQMMQAFFATHFAQMNNRIDGLAGRVEEGTAAAKRTEKEVERGVATFESKLEQEQKRRFDLALNMVNLQTENPGLWKFVVAWRKGGTQEAIAARMGWKSQGTVSKKLGELKRLYPALTIDGGERIHNSRKAKAGGGNRRKIGGRMVPSGK